MINYLHLAWINNLWYLVLKARCFAFGSFLEIPGTAVPISFCAGGETKIAAPFTGVDCPIVMKQYVIDELRSADYIKLKKHLDETYGSAEMGAVYWVPLPEDILTEIQRSHTHCQPFYFAIDISENRCALELLVRTKNRVRCACIEYASKDQRTWIMDIADSLFEKLNIPT